MSIDIFKGEDKQHYVSVKARNGRILSTSEGYKTEQGAEAGVEAIQKAVLESLEDVQVGQVEAATTPEALDQFADTYGEQLHPTAVPSSAYVIGKDRETLRSLLETAAEDGWTIIPPKAETDDDEDPES
jgi:uncharacterized protein YegP (UPF0339 family)